VTSQATTSEWRYRRTGLQSDKLAYQSACSAARESITNSRSDHIKAQLDEASGDIRATWRTAQRLLHSRQKIVYDDAQCAQLVSTFCQFFVDNVRRIRDNISATLQSSGCRTFAVRQHFGPELSSFEPVTIEEARKLLSTMPSKSCAHVFAPAIARLANLSLQTGTFPPSIEDSAGAPAAGGRVDSSLPVNYRPISNLSTVFKVLERLVLTCQCPHLLGSANFSQYQSAYRKGHSTETALLEVLDGVFTAADQKQVTVLIALDLSAAFDTVEHRLLLDRL